MPPPHEDRAAASPRVERGRLFDRAQTPVQRSLEPTADGDSAHRIDDLARAIGSLARPARLDAMLSIGRLIIERFYDGDAAAWRVRGVKAFPLRRLAQRLSALDALSPTTLYRCLATFELVQRIGDVSTWQHITASHVRAVLPLSATRQDQLLARTEREGWSVRRLERESKRRRPTPHRRRGPPRFVAQIERLSRYVIEEERFNDLDRAAEVSPEVLRDLCATIVGVRRRCEDLSRLLEPRLLEDDAS